MKFLKYINFRLNDAIGVLPTDTIYGLVGRALSEKAVEKIYKVRKRDSKKPLIILIGSLADLKLFGIKLGAPQRKFLKKIWPGAVSVILPCRLKKFSYLHRGTDALAFRLPKPSWLRKILKKTGPLVAPSANPEGLPPAGTVREAKKYFGEAADFYVNGGKLGFLPSTLIAIKNGKIKLIREGSGNLAIIKNVLENQK